MAGEQNVIPVERIENIIIQIKGQKVIIDADLARIYGVTTKKLNQAVKRNINRFPADFLFQLTDREKNEVVTNCDHLSILKYSPHLPFAFTEHGAIMAASVLSSDRAIKVNVYVVRAFIKLREMVSNHNELANKMSELEKKLETHDEAIRSLVSAIRQLMAPAPSSPKKIGFHLRERRAAYGGRLRKSPL